MWVRVAESSITCLSIYAEFYIFHAVLKYLLSSSRLVKVQVSSCLSKTSSLDPDSKPNWSQSRIVLLSSKCYSDKLNQRASLYKCSFYNFWCMLPMWKFILHSSMLYFSVANMRFHLPLSQSQFLELLMKCSYSSSQVLKIFEGHKVLDFTLNTWQRASMSMLGDAYNYTSTGRHPGKNWKTPIEILAVCTLLCREALELGKINHHPVPACVRAIVLI